MWGNEAEIKRLWPHRMGPGVRKQIRIVVRELKLWRLLNQGE